MLKGIRMRILKNESGTKYYKKLTQTTGPILGKQKPKQRNDSTLKPGKRRPQHNKLKKKQKRNGIEIVQKSKNKLETQKSK